MASVNGAGAAAGSATGRFAAIRQCLQQQGINLPARPNRAPGTGDTGPTGPRGPGGGIFGGGGGARRGFQLPPGVTQAQLQAAMQKCGLRRFGQGGIRNNPAFRQSLTAFAACMRQNGISLPAPNTSGNGPIFNTKGIDTTSPKFAAATAKCRPLLRGAFGGGPGAAPGTGAGDQVQPGSTTGGPTPSTQ